MPADDAKIAALIARGWSREPGTDWGHPVGILNISEHDACCVEKLVDQRLRSFFAYLHVAGFAGGADGSLRGFYGGASRDHRN